MVKNQNVKKRKTKASRPVQAVAAVVAVKKRKNRQRRNRRKNKDWSTPNIGVPQVYQNHNVRMNGEVRGFLQKYAQALQRPGSIAIPAKGETGIVPMPYATARSLTTLESVAANQYLVVMVSPGLGLWKFDGILANATAGWHSFTTTSSNSAIPYADIVGNTGSLASKWNLTTGTERTVLWNIEVQVMLRIPPASLTGVCYVGNMPAEMVAGSTIDQLMQAATKVTADKAGQNFRVKCCVSDPRLYDQVIPRLVGATPGLTLELDMPNRERVSYMIFPPGQFTQLGGGISPNFIAEIVATANLLWVPVLNPIITTAVNSMVREAVEMPLDPESLAEIDHMVQQESAAPDLSVLSGSLGRGGGFSAFSQPPPLRSQPATEYHSLFEFADAPAPRLVSQRSVQSGRAGRGRAASRAASMVYSSVSDLFAVPPPNRVGLPRIPMMVLDIPGGAGGAVRNGIYPEFLTTRDYALEIADLKYFLLSVSSRWLASDQYPVDLAALIDSWTSMTGLLLNTFEGLHRLRHKWNSIEVGYNVSHTRGGRVLEWDESFGNAQTLNKKWRSEYKAVVSKSITLMLSNSKKLLPEFEKMISETAMILNGDDSNFLEST